MKNLLRLWSVMNSEFSGFCGIDTTLDTKYVERRSNAEGLPFWGITLPSYASSLERALDAGRVDDTTFSTAFGRDRRGLPIFLSGYLHRVFDRDGVLLDTPCIEAIRAIRQLSLVFGKMNLPCGEARDAKAYQAYVECENRTRDWNRSVTADFLRDFRIAASSLFQSSLNAVESAISDGELIPHHGSGQTADRLLGNKKYYSRYWPARLEKVAPSLEWLYPSARYWQECQTETCTVEPGDEIPVKVILVPKTLKTPRVIAMEPTNMMLVQQGIMRRLVPELERRTSFVAFTDQEPNKHLARSGSLSGELATIDLKEASDSVSELLVRELLANTPALSELVFACRSRTADVRGEVITLSKFASMGSALCFPMEAMVFATVVFMAIADAHNTSVPKLDLKSFDGKVRVYGDDIIVPVHYVPFVLRRLEDFNFKVNVDKSFWNGKFRESCGGDYYDGEWVTPIRLRSNLPQVRTDVEQLVSLVSFRNQCYLAGLWLVSSHLDSVIESLLGFYPVVEETSSIIGKWSFLPYQEERSHPHYQSPLVRGWRVSRRLPINSVDGISAMMKVFITYSDLQVADDHLVRSGRPKHAAIKLGYGSPY